MVGLRRDARVRVGVEEWSVDHEEADRDPGRVDTLERSLEATVVGDRVGLGPFGESDGAR